jgi:four helix bundle protein
MKTYSFESLKAWKESRLLVKKVYQLTSNFPSEEKFGLISQLRRAAVSASSNLAEGSGRMTAADQRYFYRMAFSSLMEVLNQLILANDLQYVTDENLNDARAQLDSVASLTSGLVKVKNDEKDDSKA